MQEIDMMEIDSDDSNMSDSEIMKECKELNDATGASDWNFPDTCSTVYANDYPEMFVQDNQYIDEPISVAPGYYYKTLSYILLIY